MNGFLRRVRLLQAQLTKCERPSVLLTYSDGSVREMDWMAAFMEIGGGADVVAVQYPGETGESLLAAMLPGIENGANLWEDYLED